MKHATVTLTNSISPLDPVAQAPIRLCRRCLISPCSLIFPYSRKQRYGRRRAPKRACGERVKEGKPKAPDAADRCVWLWLVPATELPLLLHLYNIEPIHA
uniref:Uncharacterized protein n=1 Tax=Arundo donax TaxID=35708 RepID=A0A0A8XUQ7_ARUDO